MKKNILILICAILIGFSCSQNEESGSTTAEKADGDVMVIVEGSALTVDEFKMDNPYDQDTPKDFLLQNVTNWVETELLYQQAKKLNLDRRKDVQWELRQNERYILSSKLLEEVIRDKIEVTDAEIEAYYEKHKDEFTRNVEERETEGIYLEDEAAANEVYQELKSGVNWDEVFQQNDGHQFGYITVDWQMDEQIAETAFRLDEGEFSKPIETNFGGYFIVKITDVKEAGSVENFDLIKENLRQYLKREKYRTALDDYIQELKENSKIELNSDILGTTELPEKEQYMGPWD